VLQEKFEPTKGVIWSRKSKERHYKGQRKKYKKRKSGQQNITKKTLAGQACY